MGGEAYVAVAPGEYAEVVEAHSVEAVEFGQEPRAVASPSFASEYGAIPEVGAYEVVYRVVEIELSVFHGDESGLCRVGVGFGGAA